MGLLLTLSGVPGVWRSFQLWGSLVVLVYWPLAFLVLRRRYGEHRTQREWQHQRQGRSRANRAMFGYLMPFAALFFLVFSLIDAGPAMRAAGGGGRVGTLLVTSKSCTQDECSWYGTFRSDDGQVVRRNVFMHDAVPAGTQPGSAIRARDTGDRTGVFAVAGSRDWQSGMALLIMSGTYLIGWASWLTLRMWAKRRPPPEEIPGL